MRTLHRHLHDRSTMASSDATAAAFSAHRCIHATRFPKLAIGILFVLAMAVQTRTCLGTTIIVPGEANPWLAGMPDGSLGGDGQDTAPAQSPVLVPLGVTAGEAFTFSASGLVVHGGTDTTGAGPDGFPDWIFSRDQGAENGIGNINAPANALIGVFLDDSVPSSFTPPSLLDFTTTAERDLLTYSPELRQPFFIGDGVTSADLVQTFLAPAGATRLFLGTMDGYGWFDNTGQFVVDVQTPEPSSIVLAGIAALGLWQWRRRARPRTATSSI
jgi:PEP-CTERM motif